MFCSIWSNLRLSISLKGGLAIFMDLRIRGSQTCGEGIYLISPKVNGAVLWSLLEGFLRHTGLMWASSGL